MIPIARPDIGPEEVAAVTDVLSSGMLAQGRRVYVAADATCSRAKSNWQLGLELMRQAGAVIGSTEIFAFGLLGAAGTERFKRISRLVK